MLKLDSFTYREVKCFDLFLAHKQMPQGSGRHLSSSICRNRHAIVTSVCLTPLVLEHSQGNTKDFKFKFLFEEEKRRGDDGQGKTTNRQTQEKTN